jgi:hypothetical protein
MVITTPTWSIIIPEPYHTSLSGKYRYADNLTSIDFTSENWIPVWSVTFSAFIK